MKKVLQTFCLSRMTERQVRCLTQSSYLKQTLRFSLSTRLILLSLLFSLKTFGQTALPVSSGFNIDAIAESQPATSYSSSIDLTDHAFHSQSYKSTSYGFPDSRMINLNGVPYELASYAGNNAAIVYSGSSVTLNVATPKALTDIYILASATEGSGSASISVSFADGTNEVLGSASVPDWVTGSGGYNVGYQLLRSPNLFESGSTKVYGVSYTISSGNRSKILNSVTVTNGGSARFLVFALGSSTPVCVTPSAYTVTGGGIYCSGGTGVTVGLSGSETGVTYQLQVNGTNTGSPVSGTGAAIPFGNQTAAGSYTVVATRTAGSCTANMTGSPTVSISDVNTISNQVVCNNASTTAVSFSGSVAGTVYNWTNNTPSVGLAASGSGNIAAFTSTNSGTAPVTATVTVTPSYTSGGVTCTGTAKTFTITVNPTATVNTISNQVVCNNASTTAVSFSGSVAGTVYNWTNNTPSIGLAASGVGDIASFTATNATNAPVTATITVTPSYTNGGVTCAGTPKTFSITVNPTPSVTQPSNKVVCNNSTIPAITFSSSATGGIVAYSWTNSATSIGLAANGTGDIASFTATNAGTAPVTATIVVTPSFTNGGVTCTGPTSTFTITVNPTATVNNISNQVVCNNSSTAAVNLSSPTTGGSIVYNGTNTTPSIGIAASGVGNIPSFIGTNASNAPVVATITFTPSFTNGGVTCTGTPTSFTITVNPTPSVTQPSNQVVCHKSSTTSVTFSGPTTGGIVAYNWTNDKTSIGLAASGTGNIASFAANNPTNVPVTATIIVTPSFTNGGVTCTGPSKTFTITVNPTPIVSAPVAGSIFLQGGSTTLSVTASNSVAPYQYSLNNGVYQASNSFYVRAGLYTVTVKDANGCSATSSALYVPDGAAPITCPPTIRIEFNQLTANGLALPNITGYLKPFIQVDSISYTDRLFNINCDTVVGNNFNINFNFILGRDAIQVLSRTFWATNRGSIISYSCSQDIYVGAPKLADVFCLADKTLLCADSRTAPADTVVNSYTVLGTGYPTIFGQFLGQGLVRNLTATYNDERINNTNGFTIKRTWIYKNICTGETRRCVQNLTYRSDAGTCPTALSTISGKIRREDLMDIPAKISVFNGANEVLNSLTNPTYSFNNLLINKGYRIKAERPNTDWTNGVTTFDVALISRHVLGITPLTTPYQLIAADANRNGEVDAADLLHLQRLILRLDNQLTSNNSWRFVPKNYVFSDPTNPFASDFPEVLNVQNLTSAVTNGDFVAIKVGDVNNSLGSTAIRGGTEAFKLSVEDKVLEKNQSYEIPVRTAATATAIQYALTIDKTLAQIEAISKGDLPNSSDNNFGFFKNENTVTAAWTRSPNQKFEADEMFTMVNLVIKPTKTVRLSEILTINPVYTEGVAYDEVGKGAPVKLSFGNKISEGFALYQNHPNPFSDETTISFKLPQDAQANLTITSVDGKIVKKINGDYKAGLNTFVVKKSELQVSGVFYYRLETADFSAIKKLVIME